MGNLLGQLRAQLRRQANHLYLDVVVLGMGLSMLKCGVVTITFMYTVSWHREFSSTGHQHSQPLKLSSNFRRCGGEDGMVLLLGRHLDLALADCACQASQVN